MAPTIGVNLRVTGHCNQGGRKYMEDAFVVAYQQTEDQKDLEYAYFGIFDGHGGREAALFAKEHLMGYIVNQKNFWSEDDSLVVKAIRDGFITTHLAMWKEVGKWPKTMSGLPSTSGTTSSVAFIRRGKLYVGHVGDSKIVLGYQQSGAGPWLPHSLTKDHKPESTKEKKRIYSVGGLVMSKAGVERVVWNRPRIGHKGPIRRSTHFDKIPFLAVARSLGDLWSYNYSKGEFVVSPEPDVTVVSLDPRRDRCIVLASDGLWNMVSTRDAVQLVQNAEEENEQMILEGGGASGVGKPSNNPSKLLVDRALNLWYELGMRADNTSVVTVLLDPPGPPKSEVLLRQKIMQKLRPREEQSEGETQTQGQAEVNGNDNKPSKHSAADAECSKVTEDQTLREKRLSVFETRTSNLPKPVVLSPQRVHVKPLQENPQNAPQNLNNQAVVKKTDDERDIALPTNSENTPSSEQAVSSVSDSTVANEGPTQDVVKEELGSSVASDTASSEILDSGSSLTENNSHLCATAAIKDESGTCDSNKSSNADNQKECSRTHLSEVDNIVKNDNLDDRLSERPKPMPRTQENKNEVNQDALHKLVDSKASSSAHKRKGDSDSPVPSKNLKLGSCPWTRDSITSCQVTAVRELVRNTRSQQRSRKVKVR